MSINKHTDHRTQFSRNYLFGYLSVIVDIVEMKDPLKFFFDTSTD